MVKNDGFMRPTVELGGVWPSWKFFQSVLEPGKGVRFKHIMLQFGQQIISLAPHRTARSCS